MLEEFAALALSWDNGFGQHSTVSVVTLGEVRYAMAINHMQEQAALLLTAANRLIAQEQCEKD